MLKTFIERPVLSTVISILFVVLGIIGVETLPMEQYPDIAPPTVKVTTTYSGASADAVLNSVIVPLEESINGVEGMTYMTSTSSNGGVAQIYVYFKQGTDADIATVNVQNRVSQASSLLPSEVTQVGVTVKKQQSSNILFISYSSKNPSYDSKFLQNYVNINILPEIKRVSGVGDASIFGYNTYSMRIWLKPDVLAAYNLSASEVIAAISDQNVEAAPGKLGADSNQSFEYTLKYTGRLKSIEQFKNIIIRSHNSQVLKLKDVADVKLGSQDYQVRTTSGGDAGILLGVSQTAGSNADEVIKNVKKVLAKAALTLPDGIDYHLQMDVSDFLDASIEKVIHTLIEAFILVFFVVFIFLQNFRATLIPAIAVPVAIIGTFFFLLVLGFSINMLTLFALVLAIGIVVDDAIVVVEAVHAHMDAGLKDPKQATIKAMGEIAPAIVSITLVMAAVFIPVSFISGTSGVFFKQFGLTLAIAIVISAINALTLSPALCALFLKPHDNEIEGKKRNLIQRFYYYFNLGFSALTSRYGKTLNFLGKKNHRWLAGAIVVVFAAILVMLMRIIPTGFVPQEDSGGVMGMISLPSGASKERTDSIVKEVIDITKDIPHIKSTAALSGVSFMSGLGSSYGSVIIKMDDWKERDMTTSEVAAILKQRTDTIPNASFLFFGTPTLHGFGLSSGVEVQMQDKTGGDINKFFDITNNFLDELNKKDEVMIAMTTFDTKFPIKEIHANIPKIKDAGLTLSDVMSTLQAYIGSKYISNFNLYGKQYRVIVQADPDFRKKESDLNYLQVKTANGMAPITEFISLEDITGPQNLTRFNLYSSMKLTIIPNYMKGYSTGDVINALKTIDLPTGYTYDFSGLSREEVNSSNQTVIIFILCLIFVYLLLCALYESYILPLAVIFSLPVGLAGVFIFIFASMMNGSGIVNNIYVQISLVMLIGLLAKNAILIVEYALQRRKQGMSIVKSAINGAVARLRPILMTSFAFIFGLLPLAVAKGAGAIGNKSIGISAIGGMLIGTVIGVLVIPILFMMFQSLQEKISSKPIVTNEDLTENKIV